MENNVKKNLSQLRMFLHRNKNVSFISTVESLTVSVVVVVDKCQVRVHVFDSVAHLVVHKHHVFVVAVAFFRRC